MKNAIIYRGTTVVDNCYILSRSLVLTVFLTFSVFLSAKNIVPDFSKNFHFLEHNSILYRSYEDSIHFDMSDSEWIAMMERRATCYQKMYEENNKVISQMTDYFQKGKKTIPNAAYDSLMVCVQEAFYKYDFDNFLIDQFTQLLIPHYEAKRDTNTLVLLYHIAGISNAEISRFQNEEAGQRAKRYYEKNLRMADHYASLSPRAARIIPLTFMNYCYTLSALGFITPREAFDTTNRYAAFLKANEALMPENLKERAYNFLDRIRRTAARIHHTSKLRTPADSTILDEMYKSSPFYQAKSSDLKTPVDSVFFYFSRFQNKEISVQEADLVVKKLAQKLFDNTARLDTIDEFDVQLLGNILSMAVELMDKNPSILKETRTTRVVSLCHQLVDIVQRTHIAKDPFFFESMLGELACKENLFKYLPAEDKMDFMNELAVKSQIATILHVGSVERIATMLFDGMIETCPEQFLGIMGLNSVEELQANKSTLRTWIGRAAAYHDLGKIGISPIINNSFRKLTDQEFAITRKHPELALRYLGVDPLFDQFKDVALGHHKWYNGKGGYPASFDNLASPWKACIDLVTLADCIDAATDFFGRNYRRNKTLKQVLGELEQGAGTIYNPVMVKALVEDEQLCHKVKYEVTDYRFELLKSLRNHYLK